VEINLSHLLYASRMPAKNEGIELWTWRFRDLKAMPAPEKAQFLQ
jgi:hypothetical protein